LPCSIDSCETTAIDVNINNTGEETVLFDLSIDGPEWSHMEPTQLFLTDGQSGGAYLYLSPNFETEEKSYSVTIKLDSENVDKIQNVEVIVTNDTSSAACQPGEPGPGNGTEPGGGTGAIVSPDRPLWKTVLVAIIAIIIIIILAIRFILLVKK
jgi:hypothetical protein